MTDADTRLGLALDSTVSHYVSGTNVLDSLSGATDNKFTWDDNGNLARDDSKDADFQYDIYSQLDTVTFPDSYKDNYLAFGYNVDGERVWKKYYKFWKELCDPGGPRGTRGIGTWCYYSYTLNTYYIRGHDGKVLAEYSPPSGGWRFIFIYAGNQRIAMRRANGNLHYYLNDHLGSAKVVIDSAGTVKDQQWYYAFGSERSSTVNTGQKYLYTGKPFDDDDGVDLYYYGARYYDPDLGRFTSVDPLASKYPGWSPYVYVRNNPLLRIDPDGLTDITFTVNRMKETKRSTIGNFTLSNSGDKKVVTGATLELPENNNKQYKSRIPAGSYDASLRTTKGSFDYPRITLKNVPGRRGIVIHRGNTPDKTTGCILVGTSAGKDRVNKSEAALTETTNYIKKIQAADKKKGEKTTITVKVVDPPEKQGTE